MFCKLRRELGENIHAVITRSWKPYLWILLFPSWEIQHLGYSHWGIVNTEPVSVSVTSVGSLDKPPTKETTVYMAICWTSSKTKPILLNNQPQSKACTCYTIKTLLVCFCLMCFQLQEKKYNWEKSLFDEEILPLTQQRKIALQLLLHLSNPGKMCIIVATLSTLLTALPSLFLRTTLSSRPYLHTPPPLSSPPSSLSYTFRLHQFFFTLVKHVLMRTSDFDSKLWLQCSHTVGACWQLL